VIAALVLASLAGLLVVTLPLTLPRRPRRSCDPRPPRTDAHRLPPPRDPSAPQPPPSPAPASSAEPAPAAASPPGDAPSGDAPSDLGAYPESLTAELDPEDEEFLAFLANELWPDDEYLEFDQRLDYDNEADGGGGKCC
jgi:hypothetical protein